MLERSIIQSSGFSNLTRDGQRVGFAVRLRQPNYRGTRLSLVEGIALTVDGRDHPAETVRLRYDGVDYGHAALDEAEGVRWAVGTTLDVLVDQPGGLEPGVHHVAATILFRHPYFPPAFWPVSVKEARHVTITR